MGIMSNRAIKGAVCEDCQVLIAEDPRGRPHKYQVLARRSHDAGTEYYRCLICESLLTREGHPSPRWRLEQAPAPAPRQIAL